MKSRIPCAAWVAFAGCAGPTGTQAIATTFDPCNPPHVVADATATSFETDAIARALELWQLGPSTGEDLPIHFQQAFDAFHGEYDDQAGVIYVNDDLTDLTTLGIVIAHEMGHAFGLHHVSTSERLSVMNPGNLVVTPTAEDHQSLDALWGACATGS